MVMETPRRLAGDAAAIYVFKLRVITTDGYPLGTMVLRRRNRTCWIPVRPQSESRWMKHSLMCFQRNRSEATKIVAAPSTLKIVLPEKRDVVVVAAPSRLKILLPENGGRP